MTSKKQVLERYLEDFESLLPMYRLAIADLPECKPHLFAADDDIFQIQDAASRLPASEEPAPKEGEKVCMGAKDDGFEYAKVPAKVESGDVERWKLHAMVAVERAEAAQDQLKASLER
jgi:hypothetical protein